MSARTGLAAREPVIVHAIALWLLTNVGAAVVEQWHWLGADEWSNLSRALVPIVTAVIATVAGLLLRHVVTPAWDWVDEHVPGVDDVVEDVTGVDVGKVLAEAEAIFPTPDPEPADS